MRSRHLNLSISTATVYADLAWVCMVILLVFGWIFDDVALAIAGLAVGLVAVSLQSRCYAIKLDANLQLAYEAGKREGVNQGVRSLRP